MRILGLDPGSRITGFGLVEARDGRLEYIGSGCIRVRSSALPERLKEIFDGVGEIVDGYAPTVMAVERVFVHRNVDSALKLGHARGAALCAAVGAGLVIHEYTPAEIKQAIVGKGNAAKAQVQHMVRALLQLPGTPQADAADALAAALCHAHTGSSLARMGAVTGRRRGRGRR